VGTFTGGPDTGDYGPSPFVRYRYFAYLHHQYHVPLPTDAARVNVACVVMTCATTPVSPNTYLRANDAYALPVLRWVGDSPAGLQIPLFILGWA